MLSLYFSDTQYLYSGVADLQPELFAKVNGEFPGDVGCFVIYFLNHLKLSPGEVGEFCVWLVRDI